MFSIICFRFSTCETAEKPEKALGSIRYNMLCEGQWDIHLILYLKPFSSHIIFQFFMKPCVRYENKNLCVITVIATTALFHIKMGLDVLWIHNSLLLMHYLVIILSLIENLNVWSNISSTRRIVSPPYETLSRVLKIRQAAEYFWRTSRCFIWWWMLDIY